MGKVCLFIDGANLFSTIQALEQDIDYHRLLEYFERYGEILRAYYYTAVVDGNAEFSRLQPLVDWLSYNGYTMITKPCKRLYDPDTHTVKRKGNMDIEIAVHMMTMAPHYDIAILFTGDGDFRCLVEAVQQLGKRVILVSSLHTRPNMLADELRRQADSFIDIMDIQSEIGRLGK